MRQRQEVQALPRQAGVRVRTGVGCGACWGWYGAGCGRMPLYSGRAGEAGVGPIRRRRVCCRIGVSEAGWPGRSA
ncbi:MAG: hypothetical protein NZ694_07400 [Tepidimonas sp.]|nr:hypothetical protein [Tepidimonas sp.]